MKRACVVCGALSPKTRCPDHERKPWEDRPARRNRSKLSGSRQQKRARYILEKYGLLCHVCGKFGADEVDHVVPLAEGGADDESNLRPIHSSPCHREKTQAEARRGAGGPRNRNTGDGTGLQSRAPGLKPPGGV